MKWAEQHLYGSSMLGIRKTGIVANGLSNDNYNYTLANDPVSNGMRGNTAYHGVNHLGNVMYMISDRKIGVDVNGDGVVDYFEAEVLSQSDYGTFGMRMKDRSYGVQGRYGFNGQEKSLEINTDGNSMTAEFWEYDARIGRRWNLDPKPNASLSWYSVFENNAIFYLDPMGDTTRPVSYKSSWQNNSDNEEYKRSGKYSEHRQRFNLGRGEEMYKVDGTYIFERDNYDNRENDYYYYNGKSWKSFTPEAFPKMPRNLVKLFFWDATLGSINPIDEFDLYVSASVKTKVNSGDIGVKNSGASLTMTMFGVQAGITSKDGQGTYANLITPANSYLTYKIGTTEVRGVPLNNMVNIPLGGTKAPKYGDFAPQLRVIQDVGVYRGIILQREFSVGKQNLSIGGRGKIEVPIGFSGMSVEATGGARFNLKVPNLIKALWK